MKDDLEFSRLSCHYWPNLWTTMIINPVGMDPCMPSHKLLSVLHMDWGHLSVAILLHISDFQNLCVHLGFATYFTPRYFQLILVYEFKSPIQVNQKEILSILSVCILKP